jgi:hypothetical protein
MASAKSDGRDARSQPRHKRAAVWLPLLLLFALLVAPTSVQATFSFAGTLSAPGQNAARAQVAVAANGYAVFVWERPDETTGCGLYPCPRIQVSARSPGGTFSPVQTLSAPDRNAFAPQVAVDSEGNAVIVWSLYDPIASCCSVVQVRARSADGTLSAVQTISAPSRNSGGGKVEVDSGGNAILAWTGDDATTACSGSPCSRVQTRTRSAAGLLGPTQYLSPAGQNASGTPLGLAANGDAVFAWSLRDPTTTCCPRIQTRARSATGALSAIQTLTGPSAYEPAVGVDAGGNAVFVWSRRYGTTECEGGPCRIVKSRARSADGSLSPVQTISTPDIDVGFYPDVVVDADGDAVLKWERWDRTMQCAGRACRRIQARVRSAAGSLTPIQTVSAAGRDSDEAAVDIDFAGNAIFVWRGLDGTTDCGGVPGCERIQARGRSAAGTLGAIQTLSASGQDAYSPDAAVDPDGGYDANAADAAAVWQRHDGSCCFRVQAAVQFAPPPL